MIKVIYGSNVDRKSDIIDENMTVRQFLDSKDFDYSTGSMHMDGVALEPGDMDRTFKSLGVTERCFLLRIKQVNNAVR